MSQSSTVLELVLTDLSPIAFQESFILPDPYDPHDELIDL